MQPGDAILFHATLLHGGMFSKTTGNRRVIQLFDLFPTPDVAHKYAPSRSHVTADTENVNTGVKVSKMAHSIQGAVMKHSAALVTSSGYGYGTFKFPHGYNFISGETWRPRVDYNAQFKGGNNTGNLYVVYDPHLVKPLTSQDNKYFRGHIYGKIYIKYILRMILMILIIVLCISYSKQLYG